MNLRGFWGVMLMAVGLGSVGCGPAFEAAGGDGGPEVIETTLEGDGAQGDAQPDKVGVSPDAGADTGSDEAEDAGSDSVTGPDAPACVPDTCEAHGYLCGSIDDGCGHTVHCERDWDRWASYDSSCKSVGGAAYACSYLDPKDTSHAIFGTGQYPHPWCKVPFASSPWLICC